MVVLTTAKDLKSRFSNPESTIEKENPFAKRLKGQSQQIVAHHRAQQKMKSDRKRRHASKKNRRMVPGMRSGQADHIQLKQDKKFQKKKPSLVKKIMKSDNKKSELSLKIEFTSTMDCGDGPKGDT